MDKRTQAEREIERHSAWRDYQQAFNDYQDHPTIDNLKKKERACVRWQSSLLDSK